MLSSVPQLCYLYNMVIDTAAIPITWKTATITPIFQEGNKFDISNYRPISLLPQIVKTFEKLIHSRMYNYLHYNDLLSYDQGGFLLNVSTNDTIGKFLSEVYESLNHSQQ